MSPIIATISPSPTGIAPAKDGAYVLMIRPFASKDSRPRLAGEAGSSSFAMRAAMASPLRFASVPGHAVKSFSYGPLFSIRGGP